MSNQVLRENITDILSIARLAPSVHNSQPWEVKVRDSSLIISINRQRALRYGDPIGRQTYISLGIFTEACLIALRNYGFKIDNLELRDDVINLAVGLSGKRGKNDDVSSLESRFTDRSIYKKTSITPTQIKTIETAWNSPDIEIRVVTDSEIIAEAANLTRQALLLALSNPDFRKELAHHLVPSKQSPYGIPLSTLGTARVKALLTKWLIKSGIPRKQEADLESKRWHSASALVFIFARGDFHDYWLESGRAYLRTSLAIQKLGLSQATSAALVEAADFHEHIEKMLNTKRRLQCVLRIGRGQKKQRKSGRYAAQDLLVT